MVKMIEKLNVEVVPELFFMIDSLEEFHKAFDLVHNDKPTIVNDATALLWSDLMVGEVSETVHAMANKDMLEILDGLVDILYTTIGTSVAYGLDGILMEAFTKVHENNMSKLGPDGKPLKSASGKVIKPEGYVPVNLKPLLEKVKCNTSV